MRQGMMISNKGEQSRVHATQGFVYHAFERRGTVSDMG